MSRQATSGPKQPSADPAHGEARLRTLRERAAAGLPLGGMDWSGLKVTEADLSGAGPFDFEQADLRGATFEACLLSGARFGGADLAGASFHNVNLQGADLSRCAARGALFTDVNLAYARFDGSDLRGALIFDANLADLSLKGAQMEGCTVEAVRLSLNGSTQVLGLKEALRVLAGEESYPYIAGVSGDPFWLTYYTRTGELQWGGFANDTLRRGLAAFGFSCEFLDEVEEEEAWDRLRNALADGRTVITPLQVSPPTLLGSGLGGAEWVCVTGIDRGDLLVNCLLGDGLRFSQERFRKGWCVHHPLEESAADLPMVYALCLIGPRERTPTGAETTREGLKGAVEILTLPSNDTLAFGFDAYAALIEDLQAPGGPEELPQDQARRFRPWLGLSMLNHHGSRWAVRDFLAEVLRRGECDGAAREALAEAHELYAGVCEELRRFLEIMPWGFDDPSLFDEAQRLYHAHREEGGTLLRSAAALERDALARLRSLQP
ncbi:MAG: pentapeptide repeat-containing protein [Planctomycetaceae bacterium]